MKFDPDSMRQRLKAAGFVAAPPDWKRRQAKAGKFGKSFGVCACDKSRLSVKLVIPNIVYRTKNGRALHMGDLYCCSDCLALSIWNVPASRGKSARAGIPASLFEPHRIQAVFHGRMHCSGQHFRTVEGVIVLRASTVRDLRESHPFVFRQREKREKREKLVKVGDTWTGKFQKRESFGAALIRLGKERSKP